MSQGQNVSGLVVVEGNYPWPDFAQEVNRSGPELPFCGDWAIVNSDTLLTAFCQHIGGRRKWDEVIKANTYARILCCIGILLVVLNTKQCLICYLDQFGRFGRDLLWGRKVGLGCFGWDLLRRIKFGCSGSRKCNNVVVRENQFVWVVWDQDGMLALIRQY